MNQKPLTTSEDLIRAFAQAMDLINPELQNHHQQVAYLSLKIAEEMDLPETDRQKVYSTPWASAHFWALLLVEHFGYPKKIMLITSLLIIILYFCIKHPSSSHTC
jgi:hypothetical protein